jgi:molecular chaperone DnaJ
VDLVTRVRVPFTDAALGSEVRVPALEPESEEATVPLAVPAGTQPGSLFTMKGRGVPRLDGRGRGSLVVVVEIEVPTALSARARELLSELSMELEGDAGSAKRAAGAK